MFLEEAAELALSFSGCGFLSVYHFGVLSCLTKNGANVLNRVKLCGGASAGSLAAGIFLLAPHRAQEVLAQLYKLSEELNSLPFGVFTPGFVLNDRLAQLINQYVPSDISAAQDRLYISVTNNKTMENRLISKFASREYLIQCFIASCFIPLYSVGFDSLSRPILIDDEFYFDGGFSNNLPVFEKLPTITVSPFSGGALISPRDITPMWGTNGEWRMVLRNQEFNVNLQNMRRGAQALFPPPISKMREYYKHGFKDAFRYLLESGTLIREEGTSV